VNYFTITAIKYRERGIEFKPEYYPPVTFAMILQIVGNLHANNTDRFIETPMTGMETSHPLLQFRGFVKKEEGMRMLPACD
jgi:hypothetical protein